MRPSTSHARVRPDPHIGSNPLETAIRIVEQEVKPRGELGKALETRLEPNE